MESRHSLPLPGGDGEGHPRELNKKSPSLVTGGFLHLVSAHSVPFLVGVGPFYAAALLSARSYSTAVSSPWMMAKAA